MQVYESVVDLIGETPLVRLSRVPDGAPATVLAKVEYVNPGGSVKDRIATYMVDAAEASGVLQPGGTIVEPTSGNTGVGLALVAVQRGYHCVFVCPDKVSQDKINVLKRLRRRGRRLPHRGGPLGPPVVLPGERPPGARDRRGVEAQPVQQPAEPARPL